MLKPGPHIALLLGPHWVGAGRLAGQLLDGQPSGDHHPPLPPCQEEVPGSHQVGVDVELTARVLG